MSKVIIEEDVENSIRDSLRTIFDNFGSEEDLFRGKNVFIKINAIDFRKECYTSPEVISAAIDLIKKSGAEEVNIIENSTQSNITRVVFNVTALDEAITERGANIIYLDEEETRQVEIGENKKVSFPKILYQKLVEEKDNNFYLSIPKLKTHSMTTVTLGVKSQMGLINHISRPTWHNFELHQFLADLYDFVRPDFTVVDGLNAIIHGHYPLENKLDQYVEPLNILIGGKDTLAVDGVGARILGYEINEIDHLRFASKAVGGPGSLDNIEIVGDLSGFQERYPSSIIGDYPENVKIIEGEERACREGCRNNTLMVLEMLHVDYGGEGPFNVIFGKGLNREKLADLEEGPILVVGPCAVSEAKEYLEARYPDRKIFTIDSHNDLAKVTSALMDFMDISTFDILPLNWGSTMAFLKAKLHGSTAETPSILG